MAILEPLWFPLKVFSILGCGLMAGVFFAFSSFVMGALALQPSAQGMTTMQAINITVINPSFMSAFIGTAIACLGLAIATLLRWHTPGAAYLLAGCLLYLIGAFGVTIAFNVPLNDALAIAKPTSEAGAALWSRYLVDWTAWNHVRTAAALAATALLSLALWASPTP
ncbi:MAG TPA: anthrone oxygenase family protein [Chroococcidiopsis sp.]